jgi:hypothetical protein
VGAITTAATVVGVTGQTDDLFWVAHRRELGGPLDNDQVSLLQYSKSSGQVLRTLRFVDEHTPVTGIAFDGVDLWVNHSGTGDASLVLHRISLATGNVMARFATTDSVVDIAAAPSVNGASLLKLMTADNRLCELANGQLSCSLVDLAPKHAAGLAVRYGNNDSIAWISNTDDNQIFSTSAWQTITSLNLVAGARVEKLAFATNNQLIASSGRTVYFFDTPLSQ